MIVYEIKYWESRPTEGNGRWQSLAIPLVSSDLGELHDKFCRLFGMPIYPDNDSHLEDFYQIAPPNKIDYFNSCFCIKKNAGIFWFCLFLTKDIHTIYDPFEVSIF